jgi:hypothetical protein
VHQVEHIAGRAAESIEFHHHQLVAGPDEFEDRGQFITTSAALAAGFLLPGDLASGRLEACLLRRMVLVEAGDADVADLCHGGRLE